MPTGNFDTEGEIRPKKKFGKPSESTVDNPDVLQPRDRVNRTEDTRSFEEIMRDWRYNQESLVRQQLDKNELAQKYPPREQYDPWGWDILGTEMYGAGAGWNKVLFNEPFKKSFMDKIRPTEASDRAEYETAKKIMSEEYGYYNPYDKSALQGKDYAKGFITHYESPQGAEERSGFVRNFFGDVFLDPITYLPGGFILQAFKIPRFLLFTGRKGEQLEIALKAFKQKSISNIRSKSSKYLDPNIEKIGNTVSKLKIQTASQKAAYLRRKELRDLQIETRVQLFHDREAVTLFWKSQLEAMHADGISDEAITTFIQEPQSRKGLAEINPKILNWVDKFKAYNIAMKREELEWKAITEVMDDSAYLHKALTPEAEAILNGDKTLSNLYDVTNDAGIARSGKDFFSQDKAFFDKYGVHLWNMHSVSAQIARATLNKESQAAVKYLQLIADRYGVAIKDMPPSGYSSDIRFFSDLGLAIPKDIEKSLLYNNELNPYLHGDRNAGRQVLRGISIAKNIMLEGNAWLTHFSEKLKTRFFPPFWVVNWVGGKWLSWMGGKFDPTETIDWIRYASSAKKIARNGEMVIVTTPKGVELTLKDINKIMELKGWKKVNIGGVSGDAMTDLLSKPGMKLEEDVRYSMLVSTLRDKEPAEAIEYVDKFQGNYNQVFGKAEQHVADNIMFYRWQKFILPLLAEMVIRDPAKLALTGKLVSETWNSLRAQTVRTQLTQQELSAGAPYIGGENASYGGSLNLPITTGTQLLSSMRMSINRTTGEFDPNVFISNFGPIAQWSYMYQTGKEPYWGSNITDPLTSIAKIPFGRHMSYWDYLKDTSISADKRLLGAITGFKIKSGVSLLAYSHFIDKTNEKVVNNSIRRLGGRARGCGF